MADRETFEVEALGHVVGGRTEPTDDFWGGTRAIIRLIGSRFTPDATKGLEDFSHLEVVFRFHLTDPTDLNLGARRPRDNPDWPQVGTFGHRNIRAPQLARRLALPPDQSRRPGPPRRRPRRGGRHPGPGREIVVRRDGSARRAAPSRLDHHHAP